MQNVNESSNGKLFSFSIFDLNIIKFRKEKHAIIDTTDIPPIVNNCKVGNKHTITVKHFTFD